MKRRKFIFSGGLAALGLGTGTNLQAMAQQLANSRRVKPQQLKTEVLFVGGGPAGIGAALSASKGIMPRELKVAEIQDALRKDEVDLNMGGKVQENDSKDRGA